MRVVTVARKPLRAAGATDSCLTHQTGALAIHACRVPTSSGRGRWPGNVALCHRSGCVVVGTKRVPAGKAHRSKSGGKNIFTSQQKPRLDDMSYGVDGYEEVPDWQCEGGCPAGELEQRIAGASRFFKQFTKSNVP